MEKIKSYLFAAISMIMGSFLPYVYSFAKDAQLFVYLISFMCIAFGIGILVLLQYNEKVHRIKYALLLFVIDDQNRLLTTYNPYHKR